MDADAKLSITLEQTEPTLQSIGFYVTHGNGSQLVVLSPEDLIVKSSFQRQRSGMIQLMVINSVNKS